MSKVRSRHANCSVLNCKDEHRSLYGLPADEEKRAEWLCFIFGGNVPQAIPKQPLVCANHFSRTCFTNLGQYESGFARILSLKAGSTPTIRGETADMGGGTTRSSCGILPAVRHVASQTDPPEYANAQLWMKTPERKSVGTQLSKRTLQSHYRSKATQVRVSSRDCGMCTLTIPLDSPLLFLQPTIIKRPSKRPLLSLEDEEELPSEHSLSVGGS